MPSVFPADAVIRRVTRENAILLGGPAAAILQIAHPQVGAGVANHSAFRTNATQRLHRTLDAVYTIVFGSTADAARVRDAVAAAHAPVHGKHPIPYSAASRDAQFWVLATLIATGTETFETFIAPLTPHDKERHYQDMRVFGQYFGIPPTHGPQTRTEFEQYYAEMLANPLLGSLPESREVAHAIAYPSQPRWLALATRPFAPLVAESLPSPVRERLGFRSTPTSRLALRATVTTLRAAIPLLPGAARFTPRSRSKRGERGEG